MIALTLVFIAERVDPRSKISSEDPNPIYHIETPSHKAQYKCLKIQTKDIQH
jgi:hypothetical protein